MSFIRNSILLVVSVSVCLAVAELLVRILLPTPGLTPLPPYPNDMLVQDERRSYAYRPNHKALAGGDSYRFNNFGMRDDIVMPGESIEVLAIGDSFTSGYGVTELDAWPARLEHYLQQWPFVEQPVRVLNAGVSGYNIRQIRYAAEDHIKLEPKTVVVGAYPNGANRLVSPYVWFNGYTVRQHTLAFLKLTDDGFLKALNTPAVSPDVQFWLMEHFQFAAWFWLQIGALIDIPIVPPDYNSLEAEFAEFGEELKAIKMLTDAAGADLVVMLIAHQEKTGEFSVRLKQYNEVVTAFCVANGIRVFDPTPLFENYPAEGQAFRVRPNDFHWSPLGHDMAAQGLAEALVPISAEP